MSDQTAPRTLTLQRLEQNDDATYGHIVDAENKQWCVTLELPWRDNARGVSCIPAGTYHAVRRWSPDHGRWLYGLTDVPGRDDVELHIGCLPRDSKGCILLGSHFGFVDYADGKPGASGHGVTGSRAAFDAFMQRLDGVSGFTLTVVDPSAPLAATPPSGET